MNNKQKNDFSHMFESYDTEDEAIRAIVEFTVQKEMGSEKEEKPYLDHTYNFSFPGGKATVDKNSKNNFKAMSDENLEKNIRDALSTADMTTKKPKTEFDKTVAGQKSLELLNQQRTKMSSEIEQDVQSKKGTIKQIMDNNRQIYQKNELLRSGNLSPEKKVKLNDELDALQISSKNLNKSLNFKPLSRDTIRKRVKERVENEYLPRALYLLDQEDITIDKKSKFLVPLVAKVYNSPSFGPNEQKALKNEDMSKFIDEIGNHNNPKDVNGKKSNGINHRNLSTALLMEKVTKPEFLTKKLTFDMQPTDVAPHLREGKVLSTKDQNVFNDYVENSDDFKPFALETLSKKEQNSNFGKKELSALKKLGLDSGFAKPDSGFKNTNKNALNQQPKSILSEIKSNTNTKSKTKPFSFLDDDSTKNLMPSVPKFEGLGLENTKDQSQNSTQKDNWSIGGILKGNQGVLSDTMQKMRGIDPAKQGEQQLSNKQKTENTFKKMNSAQNISNILAQETFPNKKGQHTPQIRNAFGQAVNRVMLDLSFDDQEKQNVLKTENNFLTDHKLFPGSDPNNEMHFTGMLNGIRNDFSTNKDKDPADVIRDNVFKDFGNLKFSN